jgi:hypothetical protein
VSHGNSGASLALAVKDKLAPDAPFYSVKVEVLEEYDWGVRTTTLVMYRDELGFGIEQEPHKFLPELAAFESSWRAAPAAWALMPLATWEELKEKDLQMTEMARDERRIIVRKGPPTP